MSDFIKLHRCIEDWEWYKDVNTFKVFIHLLLEANWKDGFWKGRIVKRGQTVTSRSKLSRETGLSEREIRTALQHLKTTNEVTYETTKHFTLITVVNYEVYQDNSDKCDQQNDQENRQQTTTIEEIKNNKNNIYIDFFEQLWKMYPKKEGKGQVSLSQKKKLHSIGLEEMTRSIERYTEAKKGVEKKFLKQGSTFFNSGYVDYLDENYEADKPESQYQEI